MAKGDPDESARGSILSVFVWDVSENMDLLQGLLVGSVRFGPLMGFVPLIPPQRLFSASCLDSLKTVRHVLFSSIVRLIIKIIYI